MERTGSERRESRRRQSAALVVAVVGETDLACTLLDVSGVGARIETSAPFQPGEVITLRFADFGEISAEVVWRQEGKNGLRFSGEPELLNELIMAIAVYG